MISLPVFRHETRTIDSIWEKKITLTDGSSKDANGEYVYSADTGAMGCLFQAMDDHHATCTLLGQDQESPGLKHLHQHLMDDLVPFQILRGFRATAPEQCRRNLDAVISEFDFDGMQMTSAHQLVTTVEGATPRLTFNDSCGTPKYRFRKGVGFQT